jgi:predicted RNA-binding protein with PUA-like domain
LQTIVNSRRDCLKSKSAICLKAKNGGTNVNYFLAKTDPETYSIDDLERDKRTAWDGVTNPQAVRAIRAIHSGDRVFIYHSGLGVVGMAVATSESRDNPKNPK